MKQSSRNQPLQLKASGAESQEQVADEGRLASDLLTAAEVRAVLNISQARWFRLRRSGQAPSAHPVLKDRWHRQVVERWAAGRGVSHGPKVTRKVA
jgi:hypothetical protein